MANEGRETLTRGERSGDMHGPAKNDETHKGQPDKGRGTSNIRTRDERGTKKEGDKSRGAKYEDEGGVKNLEGTKIVSNKKLFYTSKNILCRETN